MWTCNLCSVSFTSESVEDHLYRNHLKPIAGKFDVYSCGDCEYVGESFDDMALHCLNVNETNGQKRPHVPTRIRKGLDHEEYHALLFTALNELIRDIDSSEGDNENGRDRTMKSGSDAEEDYDGSGKDEQSPLSHSSIIDWTPIGHRKELLVADECLENFNQKKPSTDQSQLTTNSLLGVVVEDPDYYLERSDELHEQKKKKKKKTTVYVRKENVVPKTPAEFEPLRPSPEDGRFVCRTCGQRFRLRRVAVEHERDRHHRSSTIRPFSCGMCGRRCKRRTQLQIHEQTHLPRTERRFPCSFCPKTYIQRRQLDDHERVHRGEKPYSCADCDSSFTIKASLKAHLWNHTGWKPFRCRHCDRGFAGRHHRKEHELVCSKVVGGDTTNMMKDSVHGSDQTNL